MKKYKTYAIVLLLIFGTYNLSLRSQQRNISQVEGGYNHKSTNPSPILSGKNNTHIIFDHEVIDFDAIGEGKYHTRQFNDNSWSTPKKLFEEVEENDIYFRSRLLRQEKTDFGLNIIFFKGGADKDQGLYSQHYVDASDQWSEPKPILDISLLYESINIPYSEDGLRSSLQGYQYYQFKNGSYSIHWRFWQPEGVSGHEDETKHLISFIMLNNTVIITEIVPDLANIYRDGSDKQYLAEINGSFVFYHDDFEFRTFYTSQGWSGPENISLSSARRPHLRSIGYDKIHFENNFIFGINRSSIESSYYIFDLTEKCPLTNIFDIPFDPEQIDRGLSRIDISVTCAENEFRDLKLVYYDDQSFTVYNFLAQTKTWMLVNNFDYKPDYEYWVNAPDELKLIYRNNSYQIFWSEDTGEANNQIYNIVYSNNVWSEITQVTFPEEFTKDYKGLDGYSPFEPLLGILVVPLILLFSIIVGSKLLKRRNKSINQIDNTLYPQENNLD